MDEQASADTELIAECLRAMHRDPRQVQSWHRINVGASGSGVFRLALRDGHRHAPLQEAVLKVTTRDDGADHGSRELRFYSHLAGRVSMPTPTVLGMAERDEHTCLLLSAAKPAPPPATWTNETWATLATQLGTLHNATTMAMAAETSWLVSAWSPEPGPAARESALAYWATVGCADIARSLLGSSGELARATAALPRCLTHGDFHAENLLVDERGQLMASDWQGVGVGPGTNDLAMLWQRAEADGATPLREAMLEIYADARGLPAEQPLRTAAVASEVLLLLFGWPAHLAAAPAAVQAVMAHRMRQLHDSWMATR